MLHRNLWERHARYNGGLRHLKRAWSGALRPGVCAAQQNYYEVLGVPTDATTDIIKARYRELAKATHPDVNAAADAEERFMTVRRAYDTLSQEMLRAEHDQQLGLATPRNNDPRFARFNRWRAEVVPELRAQLQIWTDQVHQIVESETARWGSQLDQAERSAERGAAAAEALLLRIGAGAYALGAVGAGRFNASVDEGEGNMDDGGDVHMYAGTAAVRSAAAGDHDGGDSSSDGISSSVKVSATGRQQQEQQQQEEEQDRALREDLLRSLGELSRELGELQRGCGDVQACVQREYDKRFEQVQARYRVYGEIVWYDVYEEVAGQWLAAAAQQQERQKAQLESLQSQAQRLASQAQGLCQ